MLYNQISKIVAATPCENENARASFLKRLEEGLLTRDENPQSHFCAYFLPYNANTKQIFLGHHKKSNLWISPGGHIDKGEDLLETLNREIEEELGVQNFFRDLPPPFLLTITSIENQTQPCKTHFDIWFLVDTDGALFHIGPKEFHDTQWLAIGEAEKIVIDQANRNALKILKNL